MQQSKTNTANRSKTSFRSSSNSITRRRRSGLHKKTRKDDQSKHRTRFLDLSKIKYHCKTYGDFQDDPQVDTFMFLADFLFNLLKSHPKYSETIWDHIPTGRELFQDQIKQLEKLFPNAVFRIGYNFDGKMPTLNIWHTMYLGGGFTGVANFLPALKRKNKTLFNLLMPYFSFISSYLKQELWNGWDLEETIEQITDSMEECDSFERSEWGREVKYYTGYVKNWHDKVVSIKTSPEELKQAITSYKPRKPLNKLIKDWMIQGIRLYEQPYCLADFVNSQKVFSDSEGEAHPEQAFRFVWSDEGKIFNWMDQNLDCRAYEIGILPFTYCQSLSDSPENWDIVKMPDWIQNFIDWMEHAADLTYQL